MGKEHDAAQTTTAYGELPEFPGSDFLAHHATTWLENATAKLGDLKLLAVANGREHPAAACIVDVDMPPALPPEHRDFSRREVERSRISAQNETNGRKRFTITMDAWTELYAKLKACTSRTAPLLSRRLQDSCDLLKTQGIADRADGYFDGPRAWQIVKHRRHLGSLGAVLPFPLRLSTIA